MKTFLTDGGNILAENNKGQIAFFKADLTFLRECSSTEFNFLSTVCTEIQISKVQGDLENFINGNLILPVWTKIASIKVMEDYSSYKPETCCNGGDYAFYQWEDWFVSQYPNGEWKFAFVPVYGTSAEFSYDKLVGNFQQDLGTFYLCNALGKSGTVGYRSQTGIEYIDGEVLYESAEVLEKHAIFASFKDLWQSKKQYIDSPNEEGVCEEYIYPALSLQDKKQIIARLKELGVEKKPYKKQRRRR